jgi:hypothetical protein
MQTMDDETEQDGSALEVSGSSTGVSCKQTSTDGALAVNEKWGSERRGGDGDGEGDL